MKKVLLIVFTWNNFLAVSIGFSVDWKIVVDFKYDESFYEDHGTGEVPQLILGTYECGE